MLVVDDELIVRDVARALLERLRAQVTLATGAIEARALLAAGLDECDLALVDVSLADGRCADLLAEIAQHMPGCQLVAISGYDPSHAPSVPGHRVRFLQKPFTFDSIRRLLHEIGFAADAGCA
ncbi:MAG: response regulator [Planctomycetota bacterium]